MRIKKMLHDVVRKNKDNKIMSLKSSWSKIMTLKEIEQK